MIRTHALYWDENNAPNMDIIINILKRNYQDSDAEGLVMSAHFYTLSDEYAKRLYKKGYAVNSKTEYIVIVQEQPYQDINCVFGYDDDFKIQKGIVTYSGSGFLRQYSKEEISEIEKMKAFAMEEEFEDYEIEEIANSSQPIELRSREAIMADSKRLLKKLQNVQEIIKDTTPYEAIGGDLCVYIDYKHTEYSKSKMVGYTHRNKKINDIIAIDNDFTFEERKKMNGVSYINHIEADILLRDFIDKKIKECNKILESSALK